MGEEDRAGVHGKVWPGPSPGPAQPPNPSLLSTGLGGCDSSRLGLRVPIWPAEAATAADLKGGSGGAEPPEEKIKNLLELN